MATQDTTGKKFMRETDARILIDRRLREADWDIENKNQVSTEETSQNGRVAFYKISKPATWLLLPYILWVSFAGYLNYSIWILN